MDTIRFARNVCNILLLNQPQVVLPDLAVLRLGVYDENGKLLGQRILPLDGLQAGYRHISLRTEANFPMSLPMLFCNIELKIYVPDGFEDFMAALSDPRGFMGAAQDRKDNMKQLGIEETGAGAASDAMKGDKKDKAKEEKKVEEPPLVLEPITLESLRLEKGFQKTGKKQTKDMEAMRKRQTKERQAMQKTQNAAIDKLIKGRSKDEIKADANVRQVIGDQTVAWSELLEKHRKEEWELLKVQLNDQQETIKKLMEVTQASQMKQLEAKHERETKALNAQQTKTSMDTAKEVANDKTLRTKGEKDRRLREKKQNNIKKFMDEKKVGWHVFDPVVFDTNCDFSPAQNATIKQGREKEKLKVSHEKQVEELTKDIQKVLTPPQYPPLTQVTCMETVL